MLSTWRALSLGVVLILGVVLGAGIASLSAQGMDPSLGTWTLNMARLPIHSDDGIGSRSDEARAVLARQASGARPLGGGLRE
jgi:hypothetical protein